MTLVTFAGAATTRALVPSRSRNAHDAGEQIPGVRVATAADGVEALHCAREEKPDLILLDVQLPKLDGFGVVWWLKSSPRTRGIPVVVASAADPHVVGLLLKDGCNDCLQKPFGWDDLIAKV